MNLHLAACVCAEGISIHWTGILDWTTGLSFFNFMHFLTGFT